MFEDAIEAIKNSSRDSSVYVGTDSQVYKKNGLKYARYATVVIVHYASKHGASIFYDLQELPEYGERNLKMRLLNEVNFATQAALQIIDHLDGRHLEIHLDLNPNPVHKSNVAVKEALGWVKGATGYDAVLKPAAFAASHASDHCVRLKMKHK